MSRPWVNNEDGPDCTCGDPTVVKTVATGGAVLICLFHTNEAGVSYRLPDEAPDNWSEMTIEQVRHRR